MIRPARHEDVLLDVVAAALLAMLGVSSLFAAGADDRAADGLGVTLVLAGALSLAVTRRQPVPVLVVTLATSLAVHELDYHQNGGGLTVLWALYVVATRLPRTAGLAAALATVALVNLSLVTAPDPGTTADRVTTSVIMLAGWALGRASRARRHQRRLEDRATVAEERAAIAREMQDLVAHELAELSVQVTAARRLAIQDPQTTQALLSEAEHTARAVVGEGRRILALLTPSGEPTDRRPLPGLGDLTDLARRYAAVGLPVEVLGEGAMHVGSGPGLLAYRAVDDALADAAQSGASRAEVCLSEEGRSLLVRVRHDGEPGSVSTSARSSGIDRRTQLYGGSLGRRTERGTTEVVLRIPATARRVTTT